MGSCGAARGLLAFLLLLAVLCFSPLRALAQEPPVPEGSRRAATAEKRPPAIFRAGALEFHPGFEHSYAYDDNIFLSRSGEKGDSIYRYIPSLGLYLPFAAQSSATGTLKYERRDFDKYDSEDSDNILTRGDLNLERIYTNFYSRTSASWEKTDDPSSSEAQSATAPRTPRTATTFETALGYGGYAESRVRLEVNAKSTFDQYERTINDRLNKWEQRLGTLGDYGFAPKTAVRLEYGFIRTDFTDRTALDQSDDSRGHFVRAGLAFAPGALITGHATFGAEFREFDDTPSTLSTGSRDATSFSSDVDLIWSARPQRTTVKMRFSSGLEAASSAGQFGYRRYRVDGTLSQGLFFISDRLELGLTPSWERDDFLSSSRKDTVYGTKVGLIYRARSVQLPWHVGVSYEHKKRSSNEDINDYKDNIVMVMVGLQF